MPGPPEVSPDGKFPLFNGNMDPLSPYLIGGPGAPFDTIAGDTAPPRTFYVSAAGSDAADGLTPATAWATVAKVNSSQGSFLPGDYILFRRGDTFTGTMLYITTAGTDGRPITYGAYGAGARPVINMTTNSSIYVDNIGGVGITSITVTGGGSSFTSFGGITYFTNTGRKNNIFIEDCDVSGFQHGISIGGSTGTDGYNGVRVNNCDLHDNRDTGMFMYGPTFSAGVFSHRNVTVSNSRAYSNLGNASNTTSHSGSGILLGSVNGGLIDQCTAYSNGANNAYVNGGPAGLWCYDSNNVTIQRSLSYSNRSGTGADGDGFDLDINVSNSAIQYCLAYDNHGAGVLAWARTTGTDWTGNTIRYNLLVGNGRGTSGGFYGEIAMGGNLNNSWIYENTCVSKDLGGTSVPAFSIGTATPVGLLLWNNIFYSNGASPILNTTTAHASTGVLFQGNDYYRPSGMSLKWGATTYTSLANWRAAIANQEQVSAVNTGYTVDPVFFQPTTTPTITDAKDLVYYFDLQLQTSSPVRGAGLNLLATFGVNPGPRDYYGNALTVPSSIGAVEVDVPPILEDASTPAIATGTSNGVITTASFSPPANTLLVALVAGGYGNNPNAPTVTITDSLGGTWIQRPNVVNTGAPSFYGGVAIWIRYLTSAPGPMSVTGTFLNLSGGRFLAVRVLTGAKPDQTGAASAVLDINTPTTAWTTPITTTVTGSVVYGLCDDPVAADAITAATGTTVVGSAFVDSTDGITAVAGKSTVPTGTPGATTLGFTNAVSQTGVLALLEILPVSTTTFTKTQTDSAGLTDTIGIVLSHAVTWVTGAFRVRTSTLRGGNTLRAAAAGTSAPAGNAAGTGAAQDAAASVAPNGGNTAATGASFDGTASVGANAENAAGTGTAYDATVSTASATNAPAENAAGTGTAYDAAVAITAAPSSADGAGTAPDATGSLGAVPAEATGIGTASTAATDITVNSGAATGTGTANDGVTAFGALPDVASGVGQAYDGNTAVTINAGVATGVGAAADALPSVGAQAEVPTGTGVAGDPSTAITVNADTTTAAGTAYDATVSTVNNVNANTEAATGSATAYDAAVSIGPAVGVAAGVGVAYDGVSSVGPAAENAVGAGSAGQASLDIGATPTAATGVGTAPDPFAAITAMLEAAAAIGVAYDVEADIPSRTVRGTSVTTLTATRTSVTAVSATRTSAAALTAERTSTATVSGG